MKPGATTRPSASIVRFEGPLNLPSSTILPSLTPTSPRKDGIPEPSTMRPFLISRSYAIAFPLFVHATTRRSFAELYHDYRHVEAICRVLADMRVGRHPRTDPTKNQLMDVAVE